MDPIAHTLTGAALASAGLRRVTPLATAALVIGANAPDVDVVMNFAGDYAALAHRRGWTHGVLALVVLPFVVAGVLLAYDRIVRRRTGAAPARAGPLLALSALAVLTHPMLDWLNNYGLRWLMPFDGRWFYGDALFIIDPWVWLTLGGVLCLAHSRSALSIASWVTFAALATALIFTAADVPAVARGMWAVGIAAIASARFAGITAERRPRTVECWTRAALAVVAAYMAVSTAANVPAKAAVRQTLADAGIAPIESIMIGPMPADPFAADVVVETTDAYHVGRWHWLSSPRFVPSPEPIPKGGGPAVEAALETLEARRYLVWSRFPYFEVEEQDGRRVVRIGDVRYRNRGGGRVSGVVVAVD